MKADLYTAQARSAGSSGLAHRTAAGFVVVTSADGGDIIALIEARQNDSDLIDHVVAMAQTNGPDAFAMLFTAGGELYLIAAGRSVATVSSASAHISMTPAKGQVLVHPVSTGINETAATIRLRVDGLTTSADQDDELQPGTAAADWAEVAVGGAPFTATVEVPATATATATATAAAVAVAEPVSEDAESTAPEPAFAPEDLPSEEDEPVAIVSRASAFGAALAEPDPAETDESAASDSDPETETKPETETETVPETDPETETVPETETEIETGLPATEEDAVHAAAAQQDEPAAPTGLPALPGLPVMVLGVSCPQGHHNHPDAVYCSQCGTKMGVHQTTVLLNGPRPPLGVLVVDDGTTYSLNEDLVIGREPTSHDDVVSGHASPMILTDDSLSLSRQHARISLADWSVSVVDLNSSNGTYLSRAGQTETWTKVEPSTMMALEPGDRLRLGARIIQVELHHVR